MNQQPLTKSMNELKLYEAFDDVWTTKNHSGLRVLATLAAKSDGFLNLSIALGPEKMKSTELVTPITFKASTSSPTGVSRQRAFNSGVK